MTALLLALLLTAQPFSGTLTEVRGGTLQIRDAYGKTRAFTLPGVRAAPAQGGAFDRALDRLRGRSLRVERDGRVLQGGRDVALDLLERGLAEADPFDLSLPRDVRERYRKAAQRR